MPPGTYVAIFLLFLATSGPIGFWIVRQLVIVYRGVDMVGEFFQQVLGYNWFWIVVATPFFMLVLWIAISLHRIAGSLDIRKQVNRSRNSEVR
jgi:hypothetical protein